MENIVWSNDGEQYNHESKEECIESLWHSCDDGIVGNKIYYGTASIPVVNNLIDIEDILEMLGERAYDNYGECAEDFPDVSEKSKKLLNNYLKKWIDKYCTITFWTVKGGESYTITEADVEGLNG
jgi:hypothetical protein